MNVVYSTREELRPIIEKSFISNVLWLKYDTGSQHRL